MRTWDQLRRIPAIVALVGLAWTSVARGQGGIIPGAGPINRSMAGASTALPVDFGSSYWNPAAISGLDRQEYLLGAELIIPSIHLQSTQPADSINGQFPTGVLSGKSRSNSGVVTSPASGVSFRLRDDSPWTFGIGVFGLVGGGENFAGSNTMPLLTGRNPPKTFGTGPNFAAFSILAIEPMASYQATRRLALAAGPVITTSSISFAPAYFAPTAPGQFGLSQYSPATNGRPFWGGGFQLGMLYNLNQDWNVGFSYKSPVFLERWGYNTTNPDGSPRYISLQAGVPAIYSLGVAYKGLPKTLIDVDVRYLDYLNTPLFGPKFEYRGLDWLGVFAVAVGGSYQLSDRVTLRGGYLFNTRIIPTVGTLANIQAPGITQQTLSLGGTLKLTDDVTASAAWVHGFRADLTGRDIEIPGSTVRLDYQYDSIVLGLNIQFGRTRKHGLESSPTSIPAPAFTPEPAPAPTPAPAETTTRPSIEPPLPPLPPSP